MTDKSWVQDSLILNKTECTELHIRRFVATRLKSHFIHHLAKSGGLIRRLALKTHTHTHTQYILGNNSVCLNAVMTKQSRAHLWERTAHAPVNKRCAEQQISPVLEITETQHPHPLVGLFVHLSEGQSTAADRCVCSRFRKRKLQPGSGTGFSALSPRREDKDQVRMSQIDLFSPLTWTNMIRRWSSLAQKKNTKPWYQKKKTLGCRKMFVS